MGMSFIDEVQHYKYSHYSTKAALKHSSSKTHPIPMRTVVANATFIEIYATV